MAESLQMESQDRDDSNRSFDLSALFQNNAISSMGGPNLASMLNNPPPAEQFPPYEPIHPTYAPSGYGRQILIYESRAYPGCRREFAYKTKFTNQSGLTTVYYRCMACRALRHRLQRIWPNEKLPAVPCIAVKNDLLINDPDYPEASNHFCEPLTIEDSNNRLKVTFERGYKRARMKQQTEENMKNAGTVTPPQIAGIKCEINESTTSPINFDQWQHWQKNLNSVLKKEDDDEHQSTSSNDGKDSEKGAALTNTNTSASAATPTTSPLRLMDDMEDHDNSSPKNRLDALLQLQEQRTMERDKSHSPDENLNNLNLQKLFEPAQPDFASLFNFFTPQAQRSPQKSRGAGLMKVINKVQKMKERESQAAAAAALQQQLGAAQLASNYVEQYLKNNWTIPEDEVIARSSAELTCSLILSLAKNVPQASTAFKSGNFQRRELAGEDLHGKTLAIVGLSKTGLEVAQRMMAFGMKIIAYDPIMNKMDAQKRNIRLRNSTDELWAEADYVTLHCPVIPQTANLISAITFSRCKQNLKIVNISKAELINENDLLEALNCGRCTGAAIDTYSEDSSINRQLLNHPKVIATPALAAINYEKQETNIFNPAAALSQLTSTALAAFLDESKVQSVKAATNLGLLLAKLDQNISLVTLKHPASAQGFKKALIAGAVAGVLQAKQADQSQITVNTETCQGNELTLVAGNASVTGYTSPAGTLISVINGKKLPSPVIAERTLAVAMFDGASLNEELKVKANMEYTLIGGGKIAFFTELTADETSTLSQLGYVVAKFS